MWWLGVALMRMNAWKSGCKGSLLLWSRSWQLLNLSCILMFYRDWLYFGCCYRLSFLLILLVSSLWRLLYVFHLLPLLLVSWLINGIYILNFYIITNNSYTITFNVFINYLQMIWSLRNIYNFKFAGLCAHKNEV